MAVRTLHVTHHINHYFIWMLMELYQFKKGSSASHISLTSAPFSSSLCVQTDSGAHPASCTVGTGGPFLGRKAWPGRDADHSPPSSAEVVNK
jgi:hypothetical protein